MKRMVASVVSAVLLLSVMIAPLSVSADAVGMAEQAQPVYATAPQLELAEYDVIQLAEYPGYEYRINGGSWQSSCLFTGLQPETKYTFDQRNKATGDVSEKVVFQTLRRGPSTTVHNEQILDYIEANGTEAETETLIAYVLQDEYGADYYFVLTEENGRAAFGLVYYGAEVNNLAFDIYFDLDVTTDDIKVEYTFLVVDSDQIVDQVTDYKTVGRDVYRNDYDFRNNSSGDYLGADTINELLNLGFKMLMDFWDVELYENLGFGFKGLGFTYYYDGLGEAACDLQTTYHTAQTNSMYQREPGCDVAGSNGYAVCTACGNVTYHYGSVPAKGAHTYDNDCDADCNDCGQYRRITHSYAFDCSAVCDVCGEKREPPAEHIWDANRQCTLCGEQGRYPGDVNGDGNVNIGDVSSLCAHVRGKRVLTDPTALAIADTNGDGKINIGDVSNLYAYVRGKDVMIG